MNVNKNDVIITMDDVGIHANVNESALLLSQENAIQAYSVMVYEGTDSEYFDALQSLDQFSAAHLVFVEECALTKAARASKLTDSDGRFPKNYVELFRTLLFNPPLLEILKEEAEAQILGFLNYGFELDMINSHQHVHMFPFIWKVLRPLFNRAKCRIRAVPVAHHWSGKQGLVEIIGRSCTRFMPTQSRNYIYPLGINHSGHLTAVSFDELKREALLLRPQAPTEIICHPGLDQDKLHSLYPDWGFKWEDEHELLIRIAKIQKVVK